MLKLKKKINNLSKTYQQQQQQTDAVFHFPWINSESLTIYCKIGISVHSVIQQFLLGFPLVIGLM